MKNKTILISSIVTTYGLIKAFQVNTTQPDMDEKTQKIAGTAILLGLFGIGIGFIFKK